MRSGTIQWQVESEYFMLNTSITHITELENAIIKALGVLRNPLDGVPHPAGKRLKDAAESFGLDLNAAYSRLAFGRGPCGGGGWWPTNEDLRDLYDKDDPFGTGDI